MTSWPSPALPKLPGPGVAPRIFDTTRRQKVLPPTAAGRARMYVCGITPYDATHIGHAATYVAFDLLNRAWRDAGLDVTYVQNVTDVDDPLLERAEATGVPWRDLAAVQISLFTQDMTALGVLAPEVYLGVTEVMPLVVAAVQRLVDSGHAYRVPVLADGEPVPGEGDVYFAVRSDPRFGQVGGLDEATMRELFAERGGDPDRPGKKDPLDCLLWRQKRPGEPAWDAGALGRGRPGWHIECTAIALEYLGMGFDVQGGGSDLLFPHHEMGAAEGHALTGAWPFAHSYVHAGMVALDGEKMSKSRGNLVFVSKLRAAGVDPAAIRLAILAHHYRAGWEWTDDVLVTATQRLHRWREALSRQDGPDPMPTLHAIRERIADDLDAPGALAAVDAWAEQQLTAGGSEPGAPGVLARAADGLLGVRL